MTTTQTLANKYRPTKLDEVYGQDIAVAALKGSFKKGIPSAILISGLYGSGKTSLANIYARMLNCATHNMCGKCMSCKFKKSHPDIVNHDCAVGGKIDEIRNVVNASRVAPSTRKRVIIMDECFPADTPVLMADGSYKNIVEIRAGDYVVTYNVDTKQNEDKMVEKFIDQGVRGDMIRVHLDDGSYQDCTANHKWWSVTRNKMIRADALEEGEEFLPFSGVEGSADNFT